MASANDGSHLLKDQDKISGKAWGRVGKFATGKTAYPKGVFFIVSNEFCERFSYYGMRAILVIYLTSWLGMSDNTATAIYHTFIVLCYFSPLFGAIIADGWIGKYKTILYLSTVYALGNLIMATTAFPPAYWLGPVIGLIIIGIGTGGIKPCVSAFGGDQFAADQKKELNQFFSVFYFAINLGSLLSTLLTPVLRSQVQCYGVSCYPLAFGVPAILMFVSLLLFFLGRNQYKISPPQGDVIGKSFKCIGRAIKNKITNRGEKKDHWLYYADDAYEEEFIADVKCVLHVFLLFIPLPIFWALFDQQGSRWTLQALKMDLSMGSWQVPPDQIQAINPILIILFIPLFEGVFYPLVDKCKVSNTPLKKMVTGMLLAALAFVLAGFLQLKVESANDVSVPAGQAGVRFINVAPCTVDVRSSWMNDSLKAGIATETTNVPNGTYNLSFKTVCNSLQGVQTTLKADLVDQRGFYVLITEFNKNLVAKNFAYPLQRAPKGNSLVEVVYAADADPPADLYLVNIKTRNTYNFTLSSLSGSGFIEVPPGTYQVSYNMTDQGDSQNIGGQFEVDNGGMYTVIIQNEAGQEPPVVTFQYTDIEPNSISWAWQIPQYVLITAGEILFSISGLQFAYSQAPANMKSVVQAGWLLTVAVGNLVDVIVAAGAWLPSQAAEFFMFAALMAVVSLIFAVMAYFYDYVDRSDYDAIDDKAALTPAATGDQEAIGMETDKPKTTEPKTEEPPVAETETS